VQGLYSSYRVNTPWLFLNIDRAHAQILGVNKGSIDNALQVYFGSLYVNDFNREGRTWQVNVQARQDFRDQVEDLKQLYVKNEKGAMVPFAAIADVKPVNGPLVVTRYNLYPAAAINGNSAPGYSSGETIAKMTEYIDKVKPASMHVEWTELAYLQQEKGNTAYWVFLLAVTLVFLVLAAQYESWSLPLAVILVVPLCLLSSIVGVLLAGMDINVFTQIGFVVLVGLASKNAILIVEYAKSRRESGASLTEATLEACQLRLRPIMMTSFAFILGVVPLVLSHGAGAEMRRTLGTAVFAGMLGVTMFGIFLTPVFYYVIQWLAERYWIGETEASASNSGQFPRGAIAETSS
jgi:multidrug efflux pump subunit AcrB